MARQILLVLFTALAVSQKALASIEDLYCGEDNCYDVLGVNRESSKQEIARAYRQMAKKFHPDMHRSEEAKQEAELKFKKIATAYEILKDDDARNDYNYMLDNPEEFYFNYYRYYRRKAAPKVDIRVVVVVCITLVSVIQYYTSWTRYDDAIKYLTTVTKYRLRAMEIAKADNLLDTDPKSRKKKTKEQLRQEEEAVIRQVIENKMDIKGGYAKPNWRDIIWVQLIFSPYTFVMYLHWQIMWVWNFSIKQLPYGDEEKLYLIRKNMGLNETQWQAVEDDKIDEYMESELWVKEKYRIWKEEQEEEFKRTMAENPRYKAYRRYMKKGPGRMTFDDS